MRRLIFLAVLALLTGVAAAQTISTESAWDNFTGVGPFGNPNTATYGQTITVNNDPNHTLDYFTFHLEGGTKPFAFQGYVMGWNGTEATGSILYQSALVNYTPDPVNYQAITFNTGGLNLTIGQQYVLFVSVSNDFSASGGGQAFAGWVPDGPDAYTGGKFVFLNNQADTSQWTSTPWDFQGDSDLAFDTNLPNPQAVPEPASLIMLGTGLVGLGGTLRKRFIK